MVAEGLTEKVVWYVVKNFAKTGGIERVAPHDLRRTCARLCHVSGGELEQIQFLLGHVSVQTTERYLGCKQKIRDAVNDRLGSSQRTRGMATSRESSPRTAVSG
jgi:site-specific recombinase XerD